MFWKYKAIQRVNNSDLFEKDHIFKSQYPCHHMGNKKSAAQDSTGKEDSV